MSLKDVLHPLTNLKQFYGFFFLVQESDGDHHFVSESLNEIFDTNFGCDTIGLLLAKFSSLFGMDGCSLEKLFASLKLKAKQKKRFLLPPVLKCLKCNFLLENSRQSHNIIAYNLNSPEEMCYMKKLCKPCNISYSFRNYTRNESDESFLYPHNLALTHLATSNETCFELKLLHYFHEQIIRNGVTFEGFCDSYNQLYPEYAGQRPMNRIRLGEAWYSFRIKYYLNLNNKTPLIPIRDFKSTDTETFLGPVISDWQDNFTVRTAATHKLHCKVLNCDATGSFSKNVF